MTGKKNALTRRGPEVRDGREKETGGVAPHVGDSREAAVRVREEEKRGAGRTVVRARGTVRRRERKKGADERGWGVSERRERKKGLRSVAPPSGTRCTVKEHGVRGKEGLLTGGPHGTEREGRR